MIISILIDNLRCFNIGRNNGGLQLSDVYLLYLIGRCRYNVATFIEWLFSYGLSGAVDGDCLAVSIIKDFNRDVGVLVNLYLITVF